eukprot:1258508-Amphidinium_carterae.1
MAGGPTGEKGTVLGCSNGKVMAITSNAAASSEVNLLHGPPAATRACTKYITGRPRHNDLRKLSGPARLAGVADVHFPSSLPDRTMAKISSMRC